MDAHSAVSVKQSAAWYSSYSRSLSHGWYSDGNAASGEANIDQSESFSKCHEGTYETNRVTRWLRISWTSTGDVFPTIGPRSCRIEALANWEQEWRPRGGLGCSHDGFLEKGTGRCHRRD